MRTLCRHRLACILIATAGPWWNDHLRYRGLGAFAHPVLDSHGTDLDDPGGPP